MAKLKIKLVKSVIGSTEIQKANVRALGLHKTNSEVVHEDNPAVRGMIFKVKHLLKVEEI